MSAPTMVLWFTGGSAVDGERRAGVVAPYKVRGSENVAGRDDLGPPSFRLCHGFNKPMDLLCFYSKESGTLCHSDSPPAAAP